MIRRLINKLRKLLSCLHGDFILKSEFFKFGSNSRLAYPYHIESPKDVCVEDNVNLRFGLKIINNKNEKVIIKKGTTLAPNVTIVTNNHIPVVGIPFFLLTSSHINDKSFNIIIEEDCWCGTEVILLAGTHLGRGCIVGAGSLVNKAIPPYAVVVGSPAKIVAVKFSIEQIMEHEKVLYSEQERFTRKYLEDLFAEHFEGKKVYGKSGNITTEEKETLEKVKKRLHFVEPY